MSLAVSEFSQGIEVDGWFEVQPLTSRMPTAPPSVSVSGRLDESPHSLISPSNPLDWIDSFISFRVGTKSEINGCYKLIADRKINNKPAYQHENGGLFLYAHPSNPAWLIARTLGSPIAPAYVLSSAPTPDAIQVRPRLRSLIKLNLILIAGTLEHCCARQVCARPCR